MHSSADGGRPTWAKWPRMGNLTHVDRCCPICASAKSPMSTKRPGRPDLVRSGHGACRAARPAPATRERVMTQGAILLVATAVLFGCSKGSSTTPPSGTPSSTLPEPATTGKFVATAGAKLGYPIRVVSAADVVYVSFPAGAARPRRHGWPGRGGKPGKPVRGLSAQPATESP